MRENGTLVPSNQRITPGKPRRTCCPYACVIITVVRVSRPCELFPDGFVFSCIVLDNVLEVPGGGQAPCTPRLREQETDTTGYEPFEPGPWPPHPPGKATQSRTPPPPKKHLPEGALGEPDIG